jgi:hypothetical protein
MRRLSRRETAMAAGASARAVSTEKLKPGDAVTLPVFRRKLHHETNESERIEHENRVLSRGRISACADKPHSRSLLVDALPA